MSRTSSVKSRSSRRTTRYSEDTLARITEGVLDRTGMEVHWNRKLGCGSYGCAFETSDPGVVCKVSEDPVEAPVCAAIIDTGLDKKMEGLAKLIGAWRLPENIFVILRENITPVLHSMEVDPDIVEFSPWYNELEMIRSTGDRLWHSKALESSLWKAYESVDELPECNETRPVYEALMALANESIFLWDLHAGNLAVRDEENLVEWYDGNERPALLMYDYGHSYSPSRLPDVKKLLKNPYYHNLGVVEEL